MLRRLCYTLVLTAFLVSTAVLGCAPVVVQQTTLQNTYTDVRADVVTAGALSELTQQVLRQQNLQSTAQEPQRAFQDLEARSAGQPDDDQQVALAELALLNAMHNESSNPTAAADWYMLAAARSYDFLVAQAPKIPIITVHGLLSSPITWINLQNDLLGDPVLRKHYQVLHFFYPAGLPILVSAQLFREKL